MGGRQQSCVRDPARPPRKLDLGGDAEDILPAYPRKSSLFEDPRNGLASVEALHAAICLLGDRDDSLLVGYRWAELWLESNRKILNLEL